MKKLFGTDGIRGKAGEFLSANKAIRIAQAAGIYFKEHSHTNKILVGKDTRRSGYMLENALVSGLTSVGYNVTQIGPMPTPAVAYLTEDMRCDAGFMISASHNPYYDNGIKIFNRRGIKLKDSAEEEIERIFYDDSIIDSHIKTMDEIGFSKRIDDVIGRYIVHIKNSFKTGMDLKGVRIVLDVANGAAYKVAPIIFSELDAEVIVINDEPNGFNINNNVGAMHPDVLAKEVVKYKADIGFSFDGDADRLVVVDEKGSIVNGDAVIGVLAKKLKDEKKLNKDEIVTTTMSNKGLEAYLKSVGLNLLRSNVGDKNVSKLMGINGINFGGEESGHIIFSDFAKTGDGIVSALQIAELIKSKGEKASLLLSPFKLYPSILENIEVSKKKPLEDIKGLDELLSKIEKKDMRHLLRYSGTENKLRILIEGEEKLAVSKQMEELLGFLRERI